MSAITRIYRIDDGKADRLIRAVSQAQAIRHVASGFTVRVATQDDIASLVGEGVKVEAAGGGVGFDGAAGMIAQTIEQRTIEAFGGLAAWKASMPVRHWIPTARGGWCSHSRNRCTDNCEAGLKPLVDEE